MVLVVNLGQCREAFVPLIFNSLRVGCNICDYALQTALLATQSHASVQAVQNVRGYSSLFHVFVVQVEKVTYNAGSLYSTK